MIRAIVPTRTDDYARLLLESMERSEPASARHVTFADNGLSESLRARWWMAEYCSVPSAPFCFAQAINMAVDKSQPDTCDLLILNDDTEIVTDYWKTRAEHLLGSPAVVDFGMISLSIEGGVGNPQQQLNPVDKLLAPEARLRCFETDKTVAFIAVLIRRAAWNKVGPMDERFVGYGFEDDDYCRRMRNAGWKVGITPRLVVRHGRDGRPHSSSFIRYCGQRKWQEMFQENQARYFEKWGVLRS